MSGKYATRVSCVRVDKRAKERLFVFLCEWSDVTASYVGRTEKALHNLKCYVNKSLNPDPVLELQLKEQAILNFIGVNKNQKILNDFFENLTKQLKLVRDSEVNTFLTRGSSSTLKEFTNALHTRPPGHFSFEHPVLGPSSFPFPDYEEIAHFELPTQPTTPSAPVCPSSNDFPTYSVVNKIPKSNPQKSHEPDIITSSKTSCGQEEPQGSVKIPSADVAASPAELVARQPSIGELSTSPASAGESPTAVAPRDYEDSERGILPFAKGALAAVLLRDERGRWLVQLDSKGSEVPSSSIKISPGWFVGSVSRDECEKTMMRHAGEEDFVVRQSANGNLALSVMHDQEVRHFPIKVTEDEKFNIGQYDFKSVNHIISYYRKNTLFYDDREAPIKLGRPLVIVKEEEEALVEI